MTNPNLQPIDEKCTDCGRYIQEGHIDCNCEKSHPEDPCGQTANLQPLRDLASELKNPEGMRQFAQWIQMEQVEFERWHSVMVAVGKDLTAALDNLESTACDCTAGTPHVHTGED